MRSMKCWLTGIVITLVAGLTLIGATGCTANSKEEQNEIVIKEFQPLTEIVDGQKNVYLIIKAENNSYWDGIKEKVKSAGEAERCNIFVSGSTTEAEWQAQDALLTMAQEAGADAIIIAPDDSARLSATVSKIYKSGIPIILIDTTLTTDDYNICYMTDNLMAGQVASKEMLHQLQSKGYTSQDSLQIAIQVGSASSQTINERLAGFCQYWTKNAPDSWEIIDEIKINGGDIGKAEDCASEFIRDYPNIRGFFGCNNGSTVGFARFLLENERKDLVLIGFDYAQETEQLVLSKDYCAATMLQRQGDMGRLGVKAALQCIEGKPLEGKFVDTGIVVINDETIQDSAIQELLKE